jgi:glycosyltransferase involved in cell wall biosynthesis
MDPGEMDIIVVANGCTDDTAEVAASFGPAVRVLTLPAASKQDALTAGDRAAADFPRIYVDADLELRADDIRALTAALSQPGVLAAAPSRPGGRGRSAGTTTSGRCCQRFSAACGAEASSP